MDHLEYTLISPKLHLFKVAKHFKFSSVAKYTPEI